MQHDRQGSRRFLEHAHRRRVIPPVMHGIVAIEPQKADESRCVQTKRPAEGRRRAVMCLERFIGQQAVAVVDVEHAHLPRLCATHGDIQICQELRPVSKSRSRAQFSPGQALGGNRGETQDANGLVRQAHAAKRLSRRTKHADERSELLEERLGHGFGVAPGNAVEQKHFQQFIIGERSGSTRQNARAHPATMPVRAGGRKSTRRLRCIVHVLRPFSDTSLSDRRTGARRNRKRFAARSSDTISRDVTYAPLFPTPRPATSQAATPQPATPKDYLERLNPEQREAIETTEGPLLILAGAGTGKTRVLTTRFAHILLTGRARPYQILAVTFTNKAAREMRERIGALLGEAVEGLWLGTFHAICARMLRRHAEYVGLTSSFTILDTDDQLRLVKQLMAPYRVDPKRWPAQGMLGIIQRWKDRGLTPERITPAEDDDYADGIASRIYAEYQARLRAVNACDFGDLMLHVVEILRTRPDVLAQYHRSFRYILVDEYQDTNTVQYLWLRLLAKREGAPSNIACVGDDDQSIYSWRGAEVENILRFEKDFPGAAVVRLERNYRSTAQILAAAAGLISHNSGRLGKTLRPGRDDAEGEKVRVIGVWDSDEEARVVGDAIETLRTQGHALSEMAILMRAGFQTRPFEERLVARGIPYRIVGGVRFYERAEIRDCLAYMRVLAQPADDLAFERIVNVPRRGVGATALQKLQLEARQRGISLTGVVSALLAEAALKGRSKDALGALMEAFSRARETLGAEGHVVAVEQLLEDCGYLQMWRDDKSLEAPGRLDNIKELIRALVDFGTLGAFLEHIALVTEGEETAGEDKVNLMTLHGAKGLEFDTVFLPGWEEGVFPSQRSMDEGGLKSLEEERRLAYVGLTRARKLATVLHAGRRRIFANWQDSIPSRFIEEIPSQHVAISGQTPFERRQATAAPSMFASGPLLARKPMRDRNVPSRPASPTPDIGVGERVFHQKFGYGVVTDVDVDRLQVLFEQTGEKRVMASFVEIVS